jgi:dTDP-glucose pyrophosphorylase
VRAWRDLLVSPTLTIRDAIARIDSGNAGIVLVTDAGGHLLGTVTDGDVRRGLLRGLSLSDGVGEVMNKAPTTAGHRDDRAAILALMKRKLFHQIPLVDERGRLVGLETIDELLQPGRRETPVVLLAGGLGMRLRPLTDEVPKPMLRIGDKPILESILDSFIEYGFCKFHFAVNYKADVIERHFGDGSKWGVEIAYLRETERLGTIGPLSLLPQLPSEPLVIMNADILTRVNFAQLLDYHRSNQAVATVCVREHRHTVPYGVVSMSGDSLLVGIEEKPVQRSMVSAGIYVIEPDALRELPRGGHCDMPTFLQGLIGRQRRVVGFPIHEFWLDIGRLEDLERAVEYFESGDTA